jgi:hypothetical protein
MPIFGLAAEQTMDRFVAAATHSQRKAFGQPQAAAARRLPRKKLGSGHARAPPRLAVARGVHGCRTSEP